MEEDELTTQLEELFIKYCNAKSDIKRIKKEMLKIEKLLKPAIIYSKNDLENKLEKINMYQDMYDQLHNKKIEALTETINAFCKIFDIMKIPDAWYKIPGGYIRIVEGRHKRKIKYISDEKMSKQMNRVLDKKSKV